MSCDQRAANQDRPCHSANKRLRCGQIPKSFSVDAKFPLALIEQLAGAGAPPVSRKLMPIFPDAAVTICRAQAWILNAQCANLSERKNRAVFVRGSPRRSKLHPQRSLHTPSPPARCVVQFSVNRQLGVASRTRRENAYSPSAIDSDCALLQFTPPRVHILSWRHGFQVHSSAQVFFCRRERLNGAHFCRRLQEFSSIEC